MFNARFASDQVNSINLLYVQNVLTSTDAFLAAINEVLALTLAGIQFTHIVDFMVMMPLGPHGTGYQRGRTVFTVLSVLLVNK